MLLSVDEGFERLAPLLKKGKLILVAGSGISIPEPSNLPGWDDLLKQFIAHCERELKPLLPEGDEFFEVLRDAEKERMRNPTRVASVLKRKLLEKDIGGYDLAGSFFGWVYRTFSTPQYNANHSAIVKTGYPYILTSNYDDLLAEAAKAAGLKLFSRVFSYNASDDIASAIYEEESCIIHLHGIYTDARLEQIVLTSEDYLRIKHDHRAFAVAVQSLLLRYSTLFVGYGASDPHLEDILEELVHLFGGTKSTSHPQTFLVLHTNKASKVLVKYKHQFRTDIIAVDDYAEATHLLERLAEVRPRTS